MNEPQNNAESDPTSANPKPPAEVGALVNQQIEPGHLAENPDTTHVGHHTDPIRWLKDLWRSRPDRVVELVFAAAIVFCSACQIGITVVNNSHSSTEIRALIGAAKRNALAAQNFADSAQGINGGIGDAVRKLQEQAQNIESARESSTDASQKALQATIENARSDLRAYVVVNLEPYPVETCNIYPTNPPCAFFHYMNVGRTPAVNVEVSAYLHVASGTEAGWVSEQTIKDLVVPPYSGLQGIVLGNNASPGTGTAHWDGKPRFSPCNSYHNVCAHSIYGLIRYKDIFGKEHETGFCLYIPDQSSEKPSFCEYGNWFDTRPKDYHIREQ